MIKREESFIVIGNYCDSGANALVNKFQGEGKCVQQRTLKGLVNDPFILHMLRMAKNEPALQQVEVGPYIAIYTRIELDIDDESGSLVL